jgi:hypothetical protein
MITQANPSSRMFFDRLQTMKACQREEARTRDDGGMTLASGTAVEGAYYNGCLMLFSSWMVNVPIIELDTRAMVSRL